MEPVVLSPIALLGGTGMILVALGFIFYAVVSRLSWKYVVLGALDWIITVAVKFALAIPLNPGIYEGLKNALPGGLGLGLFDLYVGALTGITEVALVWLVMRYTRLGRVDWNHAFAFGLGFGTIEALLLGFGSFLTILVAILSPQLMPVEVQVQLAGMNNPLLGLAPIAERFFTIWVHILSNVLIFFGVAKLQARWFWLAFLFKSLLDAWAAFGQLSGMTGEIGTIWVLEALVILFGIIGWVGTRWVRSRYPAATEPPVQVETSLAGA
jgi:uncharacterized membrane protein YhfC